MPSKSAKQKRFMAAAAHDPAFAKKAGMSQTVAKEFNTADQMKGNKLMMDSGDQANTTTDNKPPTKGFPPPEKKKKASAEPGPTGAGWYHDTAQHLKRER